MRLGRMHVVAGLALVGLLLVAPARAALTLVTQWGGNGTGDGQFNSTRGVAVNRAGDVYVVDGNNDRIQKFNPDGVFLLKFGSRGAADGQFNSPRGIAVDPAGDVFVVDTGHYYVQKFTADGTFIRRVGDFGTGPGQFESNPEGIAVDGAGNVYVTDVSHVHKFANDGTFIGAWGGQGSGDGQFSAANDVAVDRSGNVYVTDGGNNSRVQQFDANGQFIRKWGSTATGDSQMREPQGIAVRSDGHVFVADDALRTVKEFTADGTFVSSTDNFGGQSFRPYGLAFAPGDDLYMTDIQANVGNRVLRLRDAPTAPPPLPPPEVGKTANAAPVSGKVLIKLPPGTSMPRYAVGPAQANGFVELAEAAQIPLGSTLDTSRGRVGIETAVGTSQPGQTQTGQFYAGLFQIKQNGGRVRPVTELVLNERLTCPRRSGKVNAAARRSRRLWANGRGRFRTRGRHSTATVRGTKWLTADTCTTTTTTVRTGTVVVRDLVKKRNVTVKAGKRYVARAKRRR